MCCLKADEVARVHVTTIVDRERSTVNPPTARASPPSLLSASSVNEAEELAATHAAIDTSELNAVCHTDREAAIDAPGMPMSRFPSAACPSA